MHSYFFHTDIDVGGMVVRLASLIDRPYYYDQSRPDTDPEGLARTVDEILTQYGADGICGELVDLGEWYDWLNK